MSFIFLDGHIYVCVKNPEHEKIRSRPIRRHPKTHKKAELDNALYIFQAIEESLFSSYQPSPLYRHILTTVLLLAAAYAITLYTTCLGFLEALNVSGTSKLEVTISKSSISTK